MGKGGGGQVIDLKMLLVTLIRDRQTETERESLKAKRKAQSKHNFLCPFVAYFQAYH